MKKLILASGLLASVAVATVGAVSFSHAEDQDGGRGACINGPQGQAMKGDGTIADGMVYDATKGKTDAKAPAGCNPSMAMNEDGEDDGDDD